MAWGVKNVENQRKLFCIDVLSKKINMSEACRLYGISRPTGYEWLSRYEAEGDKGLQNRELGRLRQPHKTTQEIEDIIILTKFEYSRWGAKKILPLLKERYPDIVWPCKTTIEKILDRNGLTIPRKYRKRLAANTSPLAQAVNSNDIWCMDFKGWYLTKDNHKYDPFTLTDNRTRFLLKCCKLKSNDTENVWGLLDIAFREYGLPIYLRSDNGPPFASSAPGRLSSLAIKLIKAGVKPEWIEPGKPYQNGRHERMHLTMEMEGFHRGSSLHDQELLIREFQDYYNFERYHESLGQKTPGSVYVPSKRVWSGKLNPIDYQDGIKVAKVGSCGKIYWNGKGIYIGRVLSGENVGIIEEEDGHAAYFGDVFLGIISENSLEVKRRPQRKKIPSKYKS